MINVKELERRLKAGDRRAARTITRRYQRAHNMKNGFVTKPGTPSQWLQDKRLHLQNRRCRALVRRGMEFFEAVEKIFGKEIAKQLRDSDAAKR